MHKNVSELIKNNLFLMWVFCLFADGMVEGGRIRRNHDLVS